MTIIFDLDDTLYEIVDLFKKAIDKTFEELEVDDYHALYQEFRKHSHELFEFSQEREENLYIMQRERIKRALKTYGLSIDDTRAQAFHDEYEYLQYHNDLSEDVIMLLQGLIQNGHTLGLITNGDSVRQREKIKALGLETYMEDRILVSGDYDYNKPDVRLFKQMEKLCAGSNYIMIGDSYDHDICGALDAGWNAIWINKNNEHRPLDSKVRMIHNISDLKIEDF